MDDSQKPAGESLLGPAEFGVTHPEETVAQAAIGWNGKPVMEARARTTPASLICAGIAISCVLLSTAYLVKMARSRR